MENKTFASFWIRFFAALLDGAIVSFDIVVLLVLLSLFWSVNLYAFTTAILGIVLYLILVHSLILFFLTPYLISKFGGTLGKLIFGIEVAYEDGSRVSFKRALFREYIAKLASNSLFGVGYYYIFKNEKKQAWHDMLSDTYVVIVKPQRSLLGGLSLAVLIAFEISLVIFMALNFSTSKSLGSDLNVLIKSFNEKKPVEDKPLYTPPTL